DFELAPLLGDGFGETDDRRLGGRVVGLAGIAERARGRGDVDDLAKHLAALLALLLCGLAQVGGGRTDDAEGHHGVDVEHRLEVLVGHLVDRRVERIAGVVDDDVDLAEGVDRLGHELVGRARLGQVAGEHRRLTADLGARLLGDVSVEVVDEDLRAVLHEQLRRRPADAARRAGDDRRLAVEYSHSVALLLLLRVWERELYLAPLAAERDLERERPPAQPPIEPKSCVYVAPGWPPPNEAGRRGETPMPVSR